MKIWGTAQVNLNVVSSPCDPPIVIWEAGNEGE